MLRKSNFQYTPNTSKYSVIFLILSCIIIFILNVHGQTFEPFDDLGYGFNIVTGKDSASRSVDFTVADVDIPTFTYNNQTYTKPAAGGFRILDDNECKTTTISANNAPEFAIEHHNSLLQRWPNGVQKQRDIRNKIVRSHLKANNDEYPSETQLKRVIALGYTSDYVQSAIVESKSKDISYVESIAECTKAGIEMSQFDMPLSSTFVSRLMALPTEYIPNLTSDIYYRDNVLGRDKTKQTNYQQFESFFDSFGTHVHSSITLGHSITMRRGYESCSFLSSSVPLSKISECQQSKFSNILKSTPFNTYTCGSTTNYGDTLNLDTFIGTAPASQSVNAIGGTNVTALHTALRVNNPFLFAADTAVKAWLDDATDKIKLIDSTLQSISHYATILESTKQIPECKYCSNFPSGWKDIKFQQIANAIDEALVDYIAIKAWAQFQTNFGQSCTKSCACTNHPFALCDCGCSTLPTGVTSPIEISWHKSCCANIYPVRLDSVTQTLHGVDQPWSQFQLDSTWVKYYAETAEPKPTLTQLGGSYATKQISGVTIATNQSFNFGANIWIIEGGSPNNYMQYANAKSFSTVTSPAIGDQCNNQYNATTAADVRHGRWLWANLIGTVICPEGRIGIDCSQCAYEKNCKSPVPAIYSDKRLSIIRKLGLGYNIVRDEEAEPVIDDHYEYGNPVLYKNQNYERSLALATITDDIKCEAQRAIQQYSTFEQAQSTYHQTRTKSWSLGAEYTAVAGAKSLKALKAAAAKSKADDDDKGGPGDIIPNVSISLYGSHSKEFIEIRTQTKEDDVFFLESSLQCQHGTAVSKSSGIPLTESFVNRIATLPTEYIPDYKSDIYYEDVVPEKHVGKVSNYAAFDQFFDTFGTHVYSAIDLGAHYKTTHKTATCQFLSQNYTAEHVSDCMGLKLGIKLPKISINFSAEKCTTTDTSDTLTNLVTNMQATNFTKVSGGDAAEALKIVLGSPDYVTSTGEAKIETWLKSSEHNPGLIDFKLNSHSVIIRALGVEKELGTCKYCSTYPNADYTAIATAIDEALKDYLAYQLVAADQQVQEQCTRKCPTSCGLEPTPSCSCKCEQYEDIQDSIKCCQGILGRCNGAIYNSLSIGMIVLLFGTIIMNFM